MTASPTTIVQPACPSWCTTTDHGLAEVGSSYCHGTELGRFPLIDDGPVIVQVESLQSCTGDPGTDDNPENAPTIVLRDRHHTMMVWPDQAERFADAVASASTTIRAEEILSRLAAAPEPAEIPTTSNPCPAWCELSAGHGYDSDQPDGRQVRLHALNVSAQNDKVLVAIEAAETAAASGGAVLLEAPRLVVYGADGDSLTPAEAGQLASDLSVAVLRLAELRVTR